MAAEPQPMEPPTTGTQQPFVADVSSSKTAQQWLDDIKKAEKDMADWRTRARKIERIYLDQRSEAKKAEAQFAMLWANISVLQPAVYAQAPAPVVSRRFSDRDPVGRAVSEVMERSLTSNFDTADINSCLESVRDNFLLVGRGTAWVRYEPTFEQQAFELEGGTEQIEALKDETIRYDFVHWTDFIHPKCRRWEELPWLGRKVYPDKKGLTDRFGPEKAQSVISRLGKPDDSSSSYDSARKSKDCACVYEIWSKRDDKVIWLAEDWGDDFLDVQPPLYELHGFFPCPRPAYGTLPTDDLTPTPDYIYYQDQAEEINKLTARISALQDALKLVGFYPAGAEGGISTAIEQAIKAGTENKMIPVPSWAAFAQGGGAKQMIEWLPIDMVLEVLKGCVDLRKQLVSDVYEITGLSDILRGQTEASETATAQNIKEQWGSIRIRVRQQEMARFARDLTRIACEIMAEKFQPETLWRLSGMNFPTVAQKQQLTLHVEQMQQPQLPPPQGAPGLPVSQGQPPQQSPQQSAPQQPQIPPQIKFTLDQPSQEDIIQLLHDDQLRSYRIDIETDSTIAANEAQEQKSRTQFVETIGSMFAQAVPLAQQVPELVPVIGESLLFVARAYRAGRQLEEVIEQAVGQIEEKARIAVSQPPPPNPETIKAQNEAELSKQRLQMEMQDKQARLQMDAATNNAAIRLQLQKAVADHNTKAAQAIGVPPPPFDPGVMSSDQIGPKLDAIGQRIQMLGMAIQHIMDQQNAPAQIVRDEQGNAVGVRKGNQVRQIVRGPDGQAVGLQ